MMPEWAGRFFAKVNRDGPIPAHCPELGPCHVWTAGRDKDGYGMFQLDGKATRAHRLAFYLAHGRWPDPYGCHHCDNPGCVNDAHIFEGTEADNSADMVAKGRSTSGLRHWVHTQPHRRPRGERNGTHTRPDRTARGERVNTAKLTPEIVREIRASHASGAASTRQLGRVHNVAHSTIKRIIRREYWRHVT